MIQACITPTQLQEKIDGNWMVQPDWTFDTLSMQLRRRPQEKIPAPSASVQLQLDAPVDILYAVWWFDGG